IHQHRITTTTRRSNPVLVSDTSEIIVQFEKKLKKSQLQPVLCVLLEYNDIKDGKDQGIRASPGRAASIRSVYLISHATLTEGGLDLSQPLPIPAFSFTYVGIVHTINTVSLSL
ncbi:hypothetical protein J6590_094006, partial [Homalodisca vitripennis]